MNSGEQAPGVNVVLGATGCVGSRLIPRLLATGEPVRALVRRPNVRLPARVEGVRGDLLDRASLGPLFEGAKAVYFLVHAMGSQPHGGRDLVAEDRAQARTAFDAAKRAGSPRVIYVSGLGAARDARSEHLRGRHAVEEELKASGLPFTIFRAGVLLGPGSVGFEVILRSVRLPVMARMGWSDHPMQPFALSDLLDALVRARNEDAFLGRTIELGTKDRPTYNEIFARAAKAMGFAPVMVRVPRQLAPAAPLAIAFAGDIPYREAAALTESMIKTPFVVEDGGASMRELGIPERLLEESLQMGIRDAVAERAGAP
jgi:uncharacterized protein YbjT (DUF2867 family)